MAARATRIRARAQPGTAVIRAAVALAALGALAACGRTELDGPVGAGGSDGGGSGGGASADGQRGDTVPLDTTRPPPDAPDGGPPHGAPGVVCGGADGGTCPASTVCCGSCAFMPPPPRCTPTPECTTLRFFCDGPEDCERGSYCCPPPDSCAGNVGCRVECASGAYCWQDRDCPPETPLCCGAAPARVGYCRFRCG